jgi:hypothetical protein
MADDGITSEEAARRELAALATAGDAAAPGAQDQSYLAGLARSMLGQGALMGWGDEVTAKLRSIANGESYERALADERSKVKAFRKENPKAALAAELGGGFLTPGLGLAAGAIKPAASFLGRAVQGAGIGAAVGSVAGAGAAEGDRLEGAKSGAAFGAMIGPAAPIVGSLVGGAVNKLTDVAGPTLARLGARVSGSDPPAARAADFIMKRDMKAAGDTPAALRQRFADADRARTFHGGVDAANASEAASPLMLADVSPSLQRLAGSAARASPEAGARAEAVIGARQTGVKPPNAKAAGMADDAGLTTVNPLAPRPVGSTLDDPAGQHERIRTGLQRAYTLADKQHHGFAENAYRTEQEMLKALKAKADELYTDFRAAQKDYDVRPILLDKDGPVAKWTEALKEAQVTEGSLIRRALRQFTTDGKEWVKTADGVDKGKRGVDGLISRAKQAGDNNAVRILEGVQSDFINAVDNIKANDIGTKWQAARGYFSHEKQRQEAIEWGRNALKTESNATADQFAAFNADQQKLARLGILEGLERASADKKRAADLTGLFDTARVQNLLRETVPRAKGSGPYSVQPERFGDYIANEKAMVGTRDKVLGNSATAGRLADDERLTRQTLSQMFDRFKQGNLGVVPMALEAVSVGLTKIFGFREDVAQELGRRLFTARPAERDRILARLEAQWGSDKIGAFTRFLDQASTAGAVALPATGARAISESKR